MKGGEKMTREEFENTISVITASESLETAAPSIVEISDAGKELFTMIDSKNAEIEQLKAQLAEVRKANSDMLVKMTSTVETTSQPTETEKTEEVKLSTERLLDDKEFVKEF